ncbi:MAG TPA: serine hydrolase domain-containing protein [Gemmatimonadaceae bacterium]|nr:serine hydrolase domain-containing protein [Gemmatimonadaceae bacterium]
MRYSSLLTVGGALISCALSNTVRAQRGAPPDTVTRVVDKVFDAWRTTDSPGCALGVSRNGHVVYERGYGMANLETGTPITPSSIFHVASVSKQFTAMAIMLLARDGKLSIDDDIRKYLPEIRDYGTPITIRHLLTHTSGLRDQWELLSLARGRFEEDRITEADVMDIVPRQTALNFTPGAEYVYSNTGFTLLGVIVKRVSGKSLRDFADERIFKPLGMTSTHFHDDYTMLVPGRTSAYAPRGSGWRVSIPNYDTYGATSLFTTVGDLLKWEANLDNPTVGDRALIARMETPTPLTGGDTSNYGFGLSIDRYRGARVVGHGGADAGYRTDVARYPESGLATVVLCNAASANPGLLARRVADAYLGSALSAAPVEATPQGVALSPDRLQRRAGVYVEPRTMQIVELVMRDGKLMVGRQGTIALVPISEDRMQITGQPGNAVFKDSAASAFDLIPAGGRPLHFERRAPVASTSQLLSTYAGEYVSDELAGAVYRVTATDSTLLLRTGTSSPITARLVFADTFLGGGNTIQFTRARGQITGFDVTNGRVRHVKFVKRKS